MMHAHQGVHGGRNGQPPPHPSDPTMSHLPLVRGVRLYPQQPSPGIPLQGHPGVDGCALAWTAWLHGYGLANY
jgi:hypothetical protein